jgi:hypothetical protein
MSGKNSYKCKIEWQNTKVQFGKKTKKPFEIKGLE